MAGQDPIDNEVILNDVNTLFCFEEELINCFLFG